MVSIALAFLVPVASAQSVPPDRYRLQFHFAATPDPLTAAPLLETPDLLVASVCNQPALPPPEPPPVVVDPMVWVWMDPVDPLKTCRTNQAAFLTANLPAAGSASMAGYTTTIVAIGGGTQSPRLLANNRFSTTTGPPPPPPPVGKFVIGQAVQPTVNDAFVFDTPNGVMIGTQLLSAGVVGTVTAGPQIRTEGTNLLTEWQVDFASGVDGWVWEDRLIGVMGVAHPGLTGVGIRR